jgi:hypothetical protein
MRDVMNTHIYFNKAIRQAEIGAIILQEQYRYLGNILSKTVFLHNLISQEPAVKTKFSLTKQADLENINSKYIPYIDRRAILDLKVLTSEN